MNYHPIDPAKVILEDALYFLETGSMTPENAFAAVLFAAKGGGDSKALFHLACMYKKGIGCPVDVEQAVACLRESAEKGYAKAQYNLGVLLYDGAIDEQDKIDGLSWLKKAAEQGEVEATIFLDSL